MRRAFFRRGLKYAAVKPVRHMDLRFEPGQEVVGLKTHHMRFLWRKGRIGVIGDEWTNRQIEAWKARLARDEEAARREREAKEPAVVPPAAPASVSAPAATAVEPPPPPPAAAPRTGPRRVRQG